MQKIENHQLVKKFPIYSLIHSNKNTVLAAAASYLQSNAIQFIHKSSFINLVFLHLAPHDLICTLFIFWLSGSGEPTQLISIFILTLFVEHKWSQCQPGTVCVSCEAFGIQALKMFQLYPETRNTNVLLSVWGLCIDFVHFSNFIFAKFRNFPALSINTTHCANLWSC